MHILPLLILALLLSCTASKKKRDNKKERPQPSQTYLPSTRGSPLPMHPRASNKREEDRVDTYKGDEEPVQQDHGKEETVQQDHGKEETVQQDHGKEETVQQDHGKEETVQQDHGKEETVQQDDGKNPPEKIEPEKPAAPELDAGVLSVKLSFAPSDNILVPLLEFSEQHRLEIRDIELEHYGTTLTLPTAVHKFESSGIKIPPLTFLLELQWRDKTCHERIEVTDMAQTVEVTCR